jgi:rhodanese-related sulfurtransferase
MKLIAESRQAVREISWEELGDKVGEDSFIIDVREPHEFAEGSVPGAINVPRGLLEFNIQNHPELKHLAVQELLNSRLFLLCGTGGRSALAALTLEALEFKNVYSIAGGLKLKP